MKLNTFLTTNGISTERFAKEVGASHRVTVHRWSNGERLPSRKFMPLIVKATGGEVQPEDFYEDLIDE